MKNVSIIKDVLRNTPHAIAVDEGDKFFIKSLTEFGNSLVDGVSSRQQYTQKQLPAGFLATDFKQASAAVQTILNGIHFSDEEINIVSASIKNQQKKMHHTVRELSEIKSDGFRSPSSRSLNKFKSPIEKMNIVDFKARLFSSSAKRSESFSIIKNNQNIGFNGKTGQLVARDANGLASLAINRIVERIGQRPIVRTHVAVKTGLIESLSRRVNRRADFLTERETQSEVATESNQRLIYALRAKLGRKI